MKDFREYYKFPLRYDGHCYIWTADNRMAFTCLCPDDLAKTLVKVLNGELHIRNNAENNNGIIYLEGRRVLMTRGWGMLTGVGGWHLSREEAIKVQEEFANYCVALLRGNVIRASNVYIREPF